MELVMPPISASLGAMVSLAAKLDSLQLDDLELKDEMKKLTTRLLELSKAPDPPVTERIWMNDVRELSYEMENCVDAGQDWIHQIPEMNARVKEVNDRFDRYIFETIPAPKGIFPIADHRLQSVDGVRKKKDPFIGLYGTGGPIDKVSQLLVDKDTKLKVVSIVGAGGIGKTTLAKQLWRERDNKLGKFNCRAFVRMAKKPDMRRILRSILAQIHPGQPPDANEVHELIQDLNKHLQNKRYFLIIEDLWDTSVWDVASRAFPVGNHGSRIITTTEIEDVALACCNYQSTCIYEMVPLNNRQSKELFNSAVFGSGEQYPHQLEDVKDEIVRRCAGLPQAIISISGVIASQGGANTVPKREQIQSSLPRSTASRDILKQVLNFCYNCLPSCLQTCLLYLSLYPENYLILMEDIVKQWVAEGFILALTYNEKMNVARSYFDKLVNMGLIQPTDVDYSDEVLYYAVHHTVHDLITSKSTVENFVTAIDYSQRTVRFSNSISRLSLQFGSATYATKPEITGLSQVRSLAFIGLNSCFPPILEFKVLRSLILHVWADQPSTGVDLKPTSELVLLRSLHLTCNATVHLPDLIQGPKNLETLEINAIVADIPANIVHLRNWLHLRLGVGTELPDLTGILRNDTLNPAISLDESRSPANSVTTLDLLSSISRIPNWIGQLINLCTIKFVVRDLQMDDINKLQRLPFLAILSLHVQRRTTEVISFAPGAFGTLKYFEFRSGVLRLMFRKGTMPSLQRLRLGYNARIGDQYGRRLDGIEHLSNVQEIYGIVGSVAGAQEDDLKAAELAFKEAVGKDHTFVSMKRVDMVVEEYCDTEKQHVIREKDASSEKPAVLEQDSKKKINQNASSGAQFIPRKSNKKEVPSVMQSSVEKQELDRTARAKVNMEEERWNNLGRGNISMDRKLHLIETMTNNFSMDQKVGSGGYGDVYKAVYDGEEIAVKKLHPLEGFDDKYFHSEIRNLTEVSHKNIVRLVGYCYEPRHKYLEHNGEYIWAKSVERVLCFEYIHGGSLETHITDVSCELDWPTCYNIIRGTCEGLNHLHSAFTKPIFHLDLKPANILLDKSMTPKISDLGLSRVFASSKTHEIEILQEKSGYMPPEYIDSCLISKKFDVFSFGIIIIKMLAGNNGYFRYSEMSAEEFIKLVSEKWTKRLQGMQHLFSSHDEDILRVTTCAEIALRCVEKDRSKRPCIQDILQKLEDLQVESKTMSLTSDLTKDKIFQKSCDSNVLSVDPTLELRFPFEPRKKVSSCLQITNKTDGFIAFNLKINRKKYWAEPSRGTMPPCSRRYIMVTMEAQAKAPPNMWCDDMFLVQSTSVTQQQAYGLPEIDYNELFEMAMAEKEMDVVTLPIVYVTLDQ